MGSLITQEQIDRLVTLALAEDLGTGDVTTDSIVLADSVCEAVITAKEKLVVCGLPVVRAVFTKLDAETVFHHPEIAEGTEIQKGQPLMKIRAKASALLKGERSALNILQRLSGIATLTRKFVKEAGAVQILDTRKTTPGLRAFEKYAVHCGGGTNHRFGLFDAVLIKDNHIKIAGGIGAAVERVRKNNSYAGLIEVETTCLKEVREALDSGADIIMLDNMSTDTILQATRLVAGRAKVEVSGSVSLARIKELVATGVDCISVGALTHSAPAVDISMNIKI
ncbi:MAG: carboxylating nicotinate-nucleotide diphosphorylase [Nitrospina sp.]|nr:MAG: carboxylating nicotinate-nucleotide diphosphorylase [Nitrospina sp.]